MKILITGATGFIGLRLTKDLLSKGHDIIALCRDRARAGSLLPAGVVFWQGDITDPKSIAGCCKGVDMVYHLVAMFSNELPSESAFTRFRDVNVKGLENVVKESLDANVKRFVYVSSIAAMGIVKDMPITGESKCEPYLPYQVTKREGELLVLEAIRRQGLPGIIVRPAKVYGIGEADGTYLQIIKTCKSGFFPKIGKKDTIVSHCYIDDLITNLSLLVEKGVVGKVYNFATKEHIGFYESVDFVAKELGYKVHYLPVPKWLMTSVAYMIEHIFGMFGRRAPVTKRNVMAATTDRIYDFSENERDLGFVSNVSMKEGIRRTLAYYEQMGWLKK